MVIKSYNIVYLSISIGMIFLNVNYIPLLFAIELLL